jgi:imidazolonepropionase-like amidohydrolase
MLDAMAPKVARLLPLLLLALACEPAKINPADAGVLAAVRDAELPTDAAPPAKKQDNRLVLRAARAIQPKTGTRIEPAFVDVRDGRIVSVGTTPPADAPSATDLGDLTIVPGLIDAHSHLLTSTSAEETSIVVEAVTMTDADRALRGVKFGQQLLDAGFTTVRDLGNSGHGADVALRNAFRKGWADGPTMIVSTRALAAPGGQFPRLAPAHQRIVDQEYAVVRSTDDARTLVRQAIYEGADCIKLIVDQGGVGMTLDEVRAAVDVAHAAGKKVAAHTLTEKSAEIAVAGCVDSIEHGYSITTATLAEMGRKRVFLVPTDYPLDYYTMFAPNDDRRGAVLEQIKASRKGSIDRLGRAIKANVPIAFGSDAYVETVHRHRGKEAKLVVRAYAEAGMSALAILQAATSNAAELLGLSDKTGTLEPGAPADLIAVRGDPSVDIAALEEVKLVVKRGKIVSRE